jgi:hypothetical protein
MALNLKKHLLIKLLQLLKKLNQIINQIYLQLWMNAEIKMMLSFTNHL